MIRLLLDLVFRPLIRLWLETSPSSWEGRPVPYTWPRVHAPGPNPDRILIIGSGAAAGRGVATHDLGLPGSLARSLSALTGRGTDVDVVVDAQMTAKGAVLAIAGLDLSRFDVLLLSVGSVEALALATVREWETSSEKLLGEIDSRRSAATPLFVLSIPFFAVNPSFPRVLAAVVDRRVQRLNAATDAIADVHERMTVIPVGQDHAFEEENAHVYQRWADGIALRINDVLDGGRSRAGGVLETNEDVRQEALRGMEANNVGPDPVLDGFAETARRVLGTSMAAVTLIRSDSQVMKAASGLGPIVLPRGQAFCDVTIRRTGPLIIEDATLDSRFSDYSTLVGELGVRFYAGYPIESPDGQRVGALCVMDGHARTLSALETEVLQTLAHQVEDHLWRHTLLGGGHGRHG